MANTTLTSTGNPRVFTETVSGLGSDMMIGHPYTMKKEKPFEEILEQLEGVVRDLESNELPLDEALKRFEEGVALSRKGSARLEDAERRIEEILSDGTTKPLDTD